MAASLRNLLVFLMAIFWGASPTCGAECEDEPDEDRSPYTAGLLVKFDGTTASRARHAFLEDVRSATEVEWSGFLESQIAGEYRMAMQFIGELQVEVNDRVVLHDRSEEPKWASSPPLQLDFDYHRIRITLKRLGANPRLRLTSYWSGPGFRFEPIPASQFWHASDLPASMPSRRGAELVRALRCEACHRLGHESQKPLRSPSLETVAAFLKPAWLGAFLTAPDEQAPQLPPSPVRALHARFSREEATDLMAWLDSRRTDNLGRVSSSNPDLQPFHGDAKSGQTLFMTIGCLACHSHGDVGSDGIFGGGDLSSISKKRSKDIVRRWLRDPASVNSSHRMPNFDLTDAEAEDLATFLVGNEEESRPAGNAAGDLEHGKQLARQHQCDACHQPPAEDDRRTLLSQQSDWSQGCLTGAASGGPNYHLDRADRRAIQESIQQPANATSNRSEMRLQEYQCLQCHARGDAQGLTPLTQRAVAKHSGLIDLLPAMRPPSLDSIGDKLRPEALRRSISRTAPALRPWLAVRMPRFALKAEEIDELVQYFVDRDQVPVAAYEAERHGPGQVSDPLAARLLTADGFGCTSCHAVGKVEPPKKTPIAQLGPSLSMPRERIRKIWFDRWVRNPARITARMEMPSVQIPIPHVLGGDLDRQLNAVWAILNVDKFSPPDARPVRVVRRTGDLAEPAAVLTDVLVFNGRKLIKPFLIGLSNRHNVLLDLNHARLAGWWTGDVARQRTQGKTWFWEAPPIESPESAVLPDLVLIRAGETLLPQRRGQFVTEPDAWSRTDSGVDLHYRLHFASSDSAELQTVLVKQRFETAEQGWRRVIRVDGLKRSDAIGVRSKFETSASAARYDLIEDLVVATADDSGHLEMTLDYHSGQQPDPTVSATPDIAKSKRSQFDVLPGFQVTRLPLRSDLMPTALAWRPDGELVVASLKGRVWAARDSDGDGLEDELRCISDELAAPYGLSATKDYVDVLCKYAVVRLHDRDHDGLTERHELVASGWGHTDDYHDWAVGLPQDEEGGYYIAIPCQQDERSIAAAHLRGTVLRLVPREASPSDPHRFRLQPISGGHRFPMGVARNRAGQVFVTDNQGNYNPFNELNHVIPGAHFGFINKLEQRDAFHPPLTTPAIDIPHPWTRSVNGICFLETPKEKANGGASFGPFEGHLVGCEYDTRRLIRMSVEEVGGSIQGAAYPFAEAAVDPAQGLQGPINCAISPDGALYVANLRDSGWGGANNTGSIVRIDPDWDSLPAGIAEVHAMPRGFRVRFARPVDDRLARRIDHYAVASYRRISTPVYGGSDVDRRVEQLTSVTVADDCMSVKLQFPELRAGFVYEFRLKPLAPGKARFYPAEAHYTLRRVPD